MAIKKYVLQEDQQLTEEQIQMIWGGNFLRVMKQVQAYSKL